MGVKCICLYFSTVDSGGAGGARAPQEFGGSEKGQSLISAYRSLDITTNTPGFKKLSTALTVGYFLQYRGEFFCASVTKPINKYKHEF